MFKNLKLGPKFVLSLMVISVVPLAIISITNYYYLKSELESKTIGHLQAINDSRAAHINDLIKLRQEQAKELAGTFLIRQLKDDGFNSTQIIQGIQSHIESIYYELKNPPKSDYKDIDRESVIEIISVWDIHGNIVASTHKELIGRKESFTFLHILYDKGAYFSGFEKDPFTGQNYLTILQGVRNWDTGEYAGVILLKSKAILDDITTVREGLGKSAETYLVDKEKRMITESRFISDAVLKVKVDTQGTRSCFGKEAASDIYRDYQGRTVLGVQKYLPDQQWCLLSEVDVEEAFEPIVNFRNQILVIVGCLIVFIMILVNWARKTFIRPIVYLKDASLKVAWGNYDVEVYNKNRDEIGELSTAFNQMTKVLSSTTTQLKEKNKILEEQQEQLKKLDQLKSEFVSMVSHELRTPMTVIKDSILQLLDEINLETANEAREDKKMLLTMGLNNVNRLANLINNLLDLSKIEAGKIELHKSVTDIVALAKEVCFSFESQAKKKGLEMRFSCPKDKLEINIDRDKIIQVFINLIGNSMKFVEHGFVELSINEDEENVMCSIIDTGRGMSEADLKKVFNKFQQFGRKDGPGVKGTGLGLSICKGLVELHQGSIGVKSELDKGTTFTFTLPKNDFKDSTEIKNV